MAAMLAYRRDSRESLKGIHHLVLGLVVGLLPRALGIAATDGAFLMPGCLVGRELCDFSSSGVVCCLVWSDPLASLVLRCD